jgi:hypothetical protein
MAVLLIGLGATALSAQTEADFKTSGNRDGTVTITKYEGWDADITIPGTIGGKQVTAIAYEAFKNCDLTGVVIPDSVKTIGNGAFEGNKLTKVSIGKGVTSIGGGAFSSNQLTSVTLGEGLLFSEDIFGAFTFYSYMCSGRKAGTYTVDKNWSDYNARKETDNFRYIETDYGLVVIGYNGDSKRLSIPDKLNGKPVKYIGGLSYKSLTGVRIPDSITSIGREAFSDNQLTSVTIPNSVTDIGYRAFSINRLTNVTIGNSVTSIGNSAFSSNQLTSVTIPANIAVEDWALADFTSFYNNNGRPGGSYNYRGRWSTPAVTISDGVIIKAGMFPLDQLKSVTLGANDVFDHSAFGEAVFYDYYCNSRKSGTYAIDTATKFSPKRDGDFEYIETKYGAYLTKYYGSDKNLVIPNKVNGLAVICIGENAFSGKQLTSVTIPNSVTAIREGAFRNNELTSIAIPNSVTYIDDDAFISNKLTSVVIPNSVTFLGYRAFCYNQLASVTIGSGVTYIRASAFGYNKLTSVTIPDGVTAIGYYAFNGNELTSIAVPANVSEVSEIDYYLGSFYEKNGKKAGTYTRPDSNSSNWDYKAE